MNSVEQARANAARVRQLTRSHTNQIVYVKMLGTNAESIKYVPVKLKGRSTSNQRLAVLRKDRQDYTLLHVEAQHIATREEIPEGYVEFQLDGMWKGSYIRSTLTEHKEEEKKMPSVIQSWVQELPFMQQSVLLSSVRGPDGLEKYNAAKMLMRFYRRSIMISSLDNCVLTNPFDERGGSFTGPSFDYGTCHDARKGNYFEKWHSSMRTVVDAYVRGIDGMPAHFTNHFREAIEVLGYKHPDAYIREFWFNTYERLVRDLNLNPETLEQMEKRLSDNRNNWLASSDPATQQ